MSDTIRIEIPVEMTDKTEPAASNVTSKINRLGDTVKKNSQTVSQFDRQTQKTERTLQSWAKQKYQAVLEAKDRVSPILSSIGGNMKSFASKTWNTTLSVVDLATKPIQGIISLLRNPILQAGAVLGISVSAADTINTYKDFEAQMSQVKAISGASGSDYERLNKKAQEMGATTKFTASEAAQGFNYMAMAGWNTDQMEKGIGGILSLAAASGEDLGTTSDIVTDALTAFNMGADEATHFADVLAVASSNANTNVGMMGETFKYVGAASGALGYSIEDVALGIGLMANAGIKSSQAGTELNSIFTRLSTNTNGARDAIEQLGISFYDQNGNARDFGKVLDELRSATKGMNNEQKINLANTIAGQRAQAGLLAMLNATEADYRKVTNAIQDADGAAQNMADTMLDNLSGSITKLQSAWEGLKLKLGERLSPYIREFAEWLTAQTPKIADAIGNIMDKVDSFAQKMRDRWKDLTGSSDWANTDFLGKLKLSWDKMIIEPLMEWWESGGKARVSHFAGEFGNFLGSALNMGIMGLLGFDTGGVLDEGASVGKSFAKGFSEGFDFKAVGAKILETIKNVIKSALKLLPGGEKGGLSSFLSAGLLGVGALKLASPIASLAKAGIGVGKLVKTVFGAGATVAGAAGMAGAAGQVYQNANGTFVAGPATTAMGGLGLGGKMLGLGTKAYGAFTGGAGTLTGGAASAAGLAGVGGAIIGGATVVSGGMDVYRAIKADDEKAKAAYAKSAGWKLGGVGAGAAIGTAIFPGLGTAIGAGIGGIAGLIGGHFEKKKYEEEMERLAIRRSKLAEVYKATGTEMDKMVFKSKELQEALEDSEMTAEEFGYMFQSEVASRAKKAFGQIKLSLSEVKSLAQQITIGKQMKAFEEFADATAKTDEAYSNYSVAQADLKQQTWKVSLGMELSDSDIDTFKSSVDNYVTSALSYVEQSQYEATVGARLIMGSMTDVSDIDAFYGSMQAEINSLSKELDKQIEIALEGDFKIDADEAEVINELQNRISEITNKLSEAQNESKLEAIKIKYSGAELDYESFTMLQEEMARFKEDAEATLEDAYVSSTAHLRMQIDDTDDEAEKQRLQEILDQRTEEYKLELKDLDVKVGSFNLETIATAWNDELDTALAGFEGTTQEKLAAALNQALAVKPEVSAWTSADITNMFGLQNVSEEAKAALIPEIQSLATMISTTTREELSSSMQSATLPVELFTSMFKTLPGMEMFSPFIDDVFSPLKSTVQSSMTSTLSEAMSGIGSSFEETAAQVDLGGKLRDAINGSLSETDLFTTLGELVQAQANGLDVSQYMEPLATKFEEAGINIPERLKESLNSNFEGVNLYETLGEVMIAQAEGIDVSQYLGPLLVKFREAEINLDGFAEGLTGSMQEQFVNAINAIDLSGGAEVLRANMQTVFSAIPGYAASAAEGLEFSGAGSAVTTGVGSAITSADMSPINSAISTLKSSTDNSVRSAFSSGISTTMPISVTPQLSLTRSQFTLNASGGGTGSATVNISANAAGGYVSGGPQLSWLAEEGWGEYVIPTNPSRRSDALRLYEQAGKSLGVYEHAAGGYVAGVYDSYISDSDDEGDHKTESYSPTSSERAGTNANVTINLNMNPEVNVSGASDPEAVLDALRAEMATMTNEMSATLAGQLKEVLSNIPHRKGAA